WRRPLFLAFAGTLILYLMWYEDFYDRSQLEPTVTFASIFFVIFALVPLFMAGPEPATEIVPVLLAMVNAGTYFLEAHVMMMDVSRAATALVMLLLAAAYLVLQWLGPASLTATAARNSLLQLVHRGLAVVFVTAAIAIRFEAHWVTIGWLLEAA